MPVIKTQTEADSLAQRIVHGIVLDLLDRNSTRVGWEGMPEDLRASLVRRWEMIAAREITIAGEIGALDGGAR